MAMEDIKVGDSNVKDIIVAELNRLKLKIAENMTKAGEVASGKTIKSMHVELQADMVSLVGRPAFWVLETGRPGLPSRFPKQFEKIILRWMKDKKIHATPIPYKNTSRPHKYTPQERGDMRMAWLISQKIKREGTLLFRKGGRDDIYSNEIPETMKRIDEKVMGYVLTKMTHLELNTKPKS